MLLELKPYEHYHASGPHASHRLPRGWSMPALGFLINIKSGQSPKNSIAPTSKTAKAVYPIVGANGPIGYSLQYNLQGSHILVGRVGSVGSIRRCRGKCWATDNVLIISLKSPRVIEKYLFYSLNALKLANLATQSSQPLITGSEIRAQRISLPPLPEQRAIVKFLDWAERRIRFIIAARKRRIQLLEEYRQALINDAVTGKFDVRTGKPYPSYEDSGVPWLGKVPEGWEIKPLKHWVRINQRNLSEETNPDFEFEYYDISSVGTGKLVEKPEVLTFKNAPSRARRLLRPGDTLFSTVRTYLKATFTYWKSQNPGMPAVASTGFAVLSPSPESWPGFVSFLTQTEAFANYVAALSVGIAYPAISETTFGAIKVPVPPLPEQRAIAEYLDRETAKIDAAIEKTKESIALWEELRETLISDVVTGKLDVREAAKKLPEAEPELEAKLEALEAALREDSEAAEPAESEDQPEEAPA